MPGSECGCLFGQCCDDCMTARRELKEWERSRKTMPSELTCPFDKAWIGPCGQPVTERSMCAEHAPLVCKSCGAPATQSCDFDGQFVCGAPLCADCEHLPPPPDAYFGVGSGHAKKDRAKGVGRKGEAMVSELNADWRAELTGLFRRFRDLPDGYELKGVRERVEAILDRLELRAPKDELASAKAERIRVLSESWRQYIARDLSLEEFEGAVAELVEPTVEDALVAARAELGAWLVGGAPNEERTHRLIDYTDKTAKLIRRRDGSDTYYLHLSSGAPTFVNVHVEGGRDGTLVKVIRDALARATGGDRG